jgi:hypothetical protein
MRIDLKMTDIVPMALVLFSVILLLGVLGFCFKYGVLLILYSGVDLIIGLLLLGIILIAFPLCLLVIWVMSFVWIMNGFYKTEHG